METQKATHSITEREERFCIRCGQPFWYRPGQLFPEVCGLECHNKLKANGGRIPLKGPKLQWGRTYQRYGFDRYAEAGSAEVREHARQQRKQAEAAEATAGQVRQRRRRRRERDGS